MGQEHRTEGRPGLQERLTDATLEVLQTGAVGRLRKALHYANNVLTDGADEGDFQRTEDIDALLASLAKQMREKEMGAISVYLGDGGYSRLIIGFHRSNVSGDTVNVELNSDASVGVRKKWNGRKDEREHVYSSSIQESSSSTGVPSTAVAAARSAALEDM